MDIQDPDDYSANTLAYNEVGDIAWKKIRKKNRATYSLLWNVFQ